LSEENVGVLNLTPGINKINVSSDDSSAEYAQRAEVMVSAFDDEDGDFIPTNGNYEASYYPCVNETLNFCDDNCPTTNNTNQTDSDADGIGDACDEIASPPESCGNGVCDSGETNESCVQDCGFVFTFWPMYVSKGFTNLTLLDEMMDTGMTFAGIYVRPMSKTTQDLAAIKSKYKIAQEISAGGYKWDGLVELVYGKDDSKFLNASCLNTTKCEYWNSTSVSIDPSYTGVLWENTLNNTYNVTKTVNPDLVLFDIELWRPGSDVEWYFNGGDPGENCNCLIVKNGIGYAAYRANWTQRGLDLKNEVKRANPFAPASFYAEIPKNGVKYSPLYDGSYYAGKDGAMASGTGDFCSPSLYVLPNLEALEKNIQSMNLSNAIPWTSFDYYSAYSSYKGNILFDASVSREAGRMLRKASARGFIVYPNAKDSSSVGYWTNNAREMIAGFKEGLSYVEKNKLQNPDFEAFGTRAKKAYYPSGESYLVGLQFFPVFWNWTDTNSSYKYNNVSFADLVNDSVTESVSGLYSWKHTRYADEGNRTIYSRNFTIDAGESGDYAFSVSSKASVDSDNGTINFYLVDSSDPSRQTKFGETTFARSWSKFEGNAMISPGEYTIKILVEDKTGQRTDVFFDNASLSAAPSPSPSPSASPNPSPSENPPGSPQYSPDVSLTIATCPIDLVFSSEATVKALLVIKGTPTCPDDKTIWNVYVTRPGGEKQLENPLPPSSCSQGTTAFKLKAEAYGAYTVEITANTTALQPEQRVGLLSSPTCNFRVSTKPPSRFPDIHLLVIITTATAVLAFLSRYSKKQNKTNAN